MLTISKVQKVKVKRTFIKGKKGVDPFHVITLEISHSSTQFGNPWLEKFQISFMSENELPLLEDSETIEAEKKAEPGMKLEWIQEDEDYARQCADEKWRSNHL